MLTLKFENTRLIDLVSTTEHAPRPWKSVSADNVLAAIHADPAAKRAFEDRRAVLKAAKVLREMRLSAGLTQQVLAERIGVKQPNVARIERGEGNRGATMTILDRAAKACGQVLILGYAPESEADDLIDAMEAGQVHVKFTAV